MKKIVLFASIILFSTSIFAQTNVSVDIYDNIYNVIEFAQMKGFCSVQPGAKPYTEKKIKACLNEILEHEDELLPAELSIINEYLELTVRKNKENKRLGSFYFEEDKWADVPMSFRINYGLNVTASAGIYNKSDYTSFGFDFMPNFGFAGDVGDKFGYNIQGILDATKMPLHKDGTYNIGMNWFDHNDGRGEKVEARTKTRYITAYSNNNYLPYSYLKPWGGQIYFISDLSASGLEGWAHELGFTGNILADLHVNLFNDKVNISAGRVYREWAAMDKRSSLALNGTALPFFGLDMTFEILPFITYSSSTGNLEYPNRDDVLMNSEYGSSLPGYHDDDAAYWENMFSINMVEVNYKGFHFDFGSSVIFPKRFELGYMYPLTNYVEYQNHIGDYDNLSLFGDLKYTKAGLGSVWASLYLDEINGMMNNPIKYTRAMYASQFGIKGIVPKLSYGSLAFRYTKVEPYCYTHHSVNYVPYYTDYVCMNYINNGVNLGYYLPPNSDEFLVRFDMQPTKNISTSFSYQLIRHGADYGSMQVRGSSIYSEMDNHNRSEFVKYFLHDGAYNWMHILSLNGAFVSKSSKLPFRIDCTVGMLVSYFTGIDAALYNGNENWYKGEEGNYGNSNVSFKTPYSVLNTEEYPLRFGPVISIGVSIGFFN